MLSSRIVRGVGLGGVGSGGLAVAVTDANVRLHVGARLARVVRDQSDLRLDLEGEHGQGPDELLREVRALEEIPEFAGEHSIEARLAFVQLGHEAGDGFLGELDVPEALAHVLRSFGEPLDPRLDDAAHQLRQDALGIFLRRAGAARSGRNARAAIRRRPRWGGGTSAEGIAVRHGTWGVARVLRPVKC